MKKPDAKAGVKGG